MGREVFPGVRNFVAIPLEGEVRGILWESVNLWKRIQPGIRWEKRGNFHITLKFIGDSTPDELRSIDEIARDVFGGYGSFRAPFTGMGAFPDLRRPRVLWLGVEFPADFLELVGRFDRELRDRLGIAPERRKFTPHITVGRVRNGELKRSLLESFRDLEDQLRGRSMRVDKIVHFKSELNPGGAIHTPIFTLSLSPGE